MHSFFLWSFTLCTIIIYKSSNIAFFVHISLISFCFQRCYFTMIQCMFFLPSTSWRLTRNWCLTRRIQMRGHHLISCCWEWRSWWRRRLLGFKRGWWKMVPLIVRPNPKLQFEMILSLFKLFYSLNPKLIPLLGLWFLFRTYKMLSNTSFRSV